MVGEPVGLVRVVQGGDAMSIERLRHWLGPAAPSPHDTELRRMVRDALIEFDAAAKQVRDFECAWRERNDTEPPRPCCLECVARPRMRRT